MIAWSLSRIQKADCPLKFYNYYITKTFTDPSNKFGLEGIETHRHFEKRVSKNEPLPSHLQKYEPTLNQLAAAKGELYVELQFAVTQDWRLTGWFDDDCWFRLVADYLVINGSTAVYVDYKTGKFKNSPEQLMYTAACIFLKWPEVETVIARYWFIKTDKIVTNTYSRSDFDKIKHMMEATYEPLKQLQARNKWDAVPSANACRFCAGKREGTCSRAAT